VIIPHLARYNGAQLFRCLRIIHQLGHKIMKHVRRLITSLAVAWTISIFGLYLAGYVSSVGRDHYHYTVDPIGEFFQVLLLFSVYSLLCVGAAWILFATPYYFLFLKSCSRQALILHAMIAGIFGFGFMALATRMLPVNDHSWKFTSPIAFVAGFFGVITIRFDLIRTKLIKPNKRTQATGLPPAPDP
jgi:hypothetical protein